MNGALPTSDDANDCLMYVDDNSGAVDAGDVVDSVANALATSNVAVPAAT